MTGPTLPMAIATKNPNLVIDQVIFLRPNHGPNRFNANLDLRHQPAGPDVMTTIAAWQILLSLGSALVPAGAAGAT